MSPELYHSMAETQDQHWWFRARREILDRVVTRAGLSPGARLLEIGAGTGGNLAMLRRHGSLSAVEADPVARRYASETSGMHVSHGCLPGPLPFADGSFDLVCLLDVLEHIEDDASALSQVHRLLKPGGCVVVTVPAYQWLFGVHDRAHHHFRRYTKGQVHRMAQAAGFRVRTSGYFNTLLFPLIALRRIQQTLTLQRDGHDAALPNRFVNGALYATFALEKFIVPVCPFPYGTSVLSVLVRNDRQGWA